MQNEQTMQTRQSTDTLDPLQAADVPAAAQNAGAADGVASGALSQEPAERDVILSVRHLQFEFTLRGQVLHALRDISLDVYRGESLAIVGESGSGKSVFVSTLMGLNAANGYIKSGSILYGGEDLAQYQTNEDWKKIRGRRIAMVMQDPMTSLNPLKTIGWQIQEAVTLHQGLHGAEAKKAVYELLTEVGIDDPEHRYRQYPHEFSGGMRQRVVIAIALACKPEILICDEPTTALDVTIQAQILDILKDMKAKYHLTTIYITHDLGVVANVADRIAVMYAGDFVEIGSCNEVFYDPRHPYTWALLSSLPQLGVRGQDLYTIVGTPPNLFYEVHGDAFAPRNPHPLKIDFVRRPPLYRVSPTHSARTWLLDSRAPQIDPPEHIRALREKGRELGIAGSAFGTPEEEPAQTSAAGSVGASAADPAREKAIAGGKEAV